MNLRAWQAHNFWILCTVYLMVTRSRLAFRWVPSALNRAHSISLEVLFRHFIRRHEPVMPF